jgi:hypothetical protein
LAAGVGEFGHRRNLRMIDWIPNYGVWGRTRAKANAKADPPPAAKGDNERQK